MAATSSISTQAVPFARQFESLSGNAPFPMTRSKFFAKEWKVLAGNAKWDLAKGAGVALLGTTSYLLHKFGHFSDGSLSVAIFLVALLVFWWATRETHPIKAKQRAARDRRRNSHRKREGKIIGGPAKC